MLKGLLKFLLWTSLLGGGGYAVYHYVLKSPAEMAPLSAIPRDAVFIVETEHPLANFKQLQRTAVWQHLLGHPWFAEVQAELTSLDSLIQANAQLADLVDGRPMTASVHIVGADDFDLLYLVDLKEASGVKVLPDVLQPLLTKIYPNLSAQVYQGVTVLKLYDPEDKTTLHLAVIDNLLALSYNAKLLYAAIDQQREPYFDNIATLQKLRPQVVGGSILSCYVHHAYLSKFLLLFSPLEASTQHMLSTLMDFTGLRLEVDDDQIRLGGFTYVHDSIPGYFADVLASGNGSIEAARVAPNRTALYLSLQFADYLIFYDRMLTRLQTDPANSENLAIKDRLEKWFRIDLKRDFVSWVGGEIALLQTLAPNGKAENVVVLHTRSVDEARAGLQRIERQIKRRSPVKFKARNYKGYEVNYLHIKGFFKLFLGKLLKDFEYPYYTILDDCVVFALSEETLEGWIDDYLAKNTLQQSAAFRRSTGQLGSTGNFFLYLDMHHYFALMRSWLAPASWQTWVDNETWIRAFPTLGIWLGGAKGHFQSKVHISFKPWLTGEDGADEAEPDAALPTAVRDTSFTLYFPSGTPKEKVVYRDGKLHGPYRSYFANGNTREMGTYTEGRRTGIWFFYTRRGQLKTQRNYDSEVENEEPGVDTES